MSATEAQRSFTIGKKLAALPDGRAQEIDSRVDLSAAEFKYLRFSPMVEKIPELSADFNLNWLNRLKSTSLDDYPVITGFFAALLLFIFSKKAAARAHEV